MLFLFLTSHGSQHGLGIQGAWLPVSLGHDSISPFELSSILDGAGIKWRVLVISGCESGVFLGPLETEFSVVATASAGDRNSFGCNPGNDFSEFGQAVFGEQLVHEWSFPTAFANAGKVISRRETERKLTPSFPQLFVGRAMDAKLRKLERRLEDANALE